MLEELAGYLVLAPLVVSGLLALMLAGWINRRRLPPIRDPHRRHRLA